MAGPLLRSIGFPNSRGHERAANPSSIRLLHGHRAPFGNKVTLSLKPAPADYGIRFQRSDLGGLEIPATVTHLGGIQYQTGLTREAVSVETVEHLLSALTALGIDNVIVELNYAGSADHGRQRCAVRLPDPE